MCASIYLYIVIEEFLMSFTLLWTTLNLSVHYLTLLTSLDLRLKIKYEIEFLLTGYSTPLFSFYSGPFKHY